MELKEFANLKYYLRLNFLYLPYSNLNIFERFKFSKSELFQILCLIVKEEFQIQLKFQGIEQEIVIPTQNRLNALVQMLMEINKSVYFAEEENQIVQQLLKLLIPLLYLNDELAIQAVNQILLIIQKIQINNERILDSTFILIIKLLDSQFFASSTSNNCIEILIKIFQVNRSFVHKFIYQMKGLEKLLKLEGSNQDQYRCLSKLVISIIYDKTLIRASIEAKIKKSIFDQENNKEIEKSNIELSKQQYYNQNTYPVCIQPVQYNVKINDQLKLSENHPTLQALKNGFFKKDVKYVMNSLFEDSQDGYLILKKGIQLDELNSIYKNNDSIQQFNFVHTQKTQTILSLLVQQLITSYFETKKQYQYDQKIIFSVLQLLILRFPLLISQIVRINCSKFLQKYKNEIGFISQDLPDKISFLSLITKYIIPPNDFIFDLCLDNIVLFKTSNNVIVPFANEIRKIIIKELHYEISQSIKNFDKKIYQYSNILLCLLQINSVAKICFQNIKEPDNSFNFIKIYKEGIKNFDILQINIFKTQLIQIIKTLRILYNLASYLILEMTMPFVLQQQDSQTQVQSISMSNLERNYQLIFINKNQNIWIKDSQIDEEVQIDQQQQILENNNIQQIYDKIDQQQLIWINNYEEGEQNEEDEQNQEYEEDEEYEEYEVYEEYEEDENLHQSETLDTDFLDCIFRPYFIQNFDQHIQYKVQLDKFIKIQDDIKNQNQVDQVQKFKKKIQQLLGIIDQQLIKQLQRLILLNYPNPNLILSEVKAFFAYFAVYQNYEIINPLIQQLKEVNQQEMSINYLQSNFIIEDYQLKKDKKYVSQFVSKIILELIYKFCEKKKCQLSQTNVNELIKFLQLFSENDHLIQLLLLVLNLATFDQVQKIQSISFEQIKLLLTLLISGKFKDKKNLKGVISKLYYNYDNQKKIKAYIYNFLEKQQQYFENCFQKQEVEIKNLFKGYQLLEIFKLIKFIYNQNSNFNIAKDIQEQQLTKLCENLQFFILDMQPQNKQLYLETIMPYLKCVLKIHQILYPKQEQIQSNIQISQISNQSSSSENNIEKIFKNLCDKGKNFINYMLQRELQNYNNKRIKKFVKDFITYYPKIIDISIKQLYLQNIIKELNGFNRNTHQFQKTILIIDRQNIFLDSYEKISQLTDFDLKNEFQIEFLNEPGIDAGGLLKEWFSKLSQEILNPRNQLFTKTINSRKYKIYRLSSNDPDHLQKFEFVGKIYAKAILQGQLIQGKIVKSFFKHILGRNLTINDFKSIDKTKYLTLTKILNEKFSCDLEWEYQVHNCVECEDEDYCINTEILELIPGGRNISVTEENKKQYIRELCYSILAKNIEDQIKAFQKGFFSLIPQKYIKIFDQNQIEQLLCGKTEIEIEDLIKNLKFKDYDVNNQVIQWLFNVLKSFSNDMLSKFLWFVAGSGLVPIGGFINLPKPIIIKKFTTNNDDQSLPISHTCTLTMELPEYSSEQILKDKLELAILEGHQTYQME
ncbi:unnamed protein product [Paramecium pentaurelia]|uniref:HECT domain-containing protein n=1 Tax=Paramecium pentaurelia TaxID=43138 RepID=A0A8S1T2K1_9CILI|nr:unnamed protein product [Paramecium pentaurelia]